MKLLIIFIILNIVNVVVQTVKSIVTIKCGKLAASVVNAVAYGIYTVVLVYMNCDLTLWEKVIIVAMTNFIGVFVVKLIEEKSRKDKLWKVEATITSDKYEKVLEAIEEANISHNVVELEGSDYVIINLFCATQTESAKVKNILDWYKAKYFVTESKSL